MAYLEKRDAADRHDGTPRMQRLRQVPRDTGRFIALLVASAPPGPWLEVGTSGGYRALAESAAMAANRHLKTFEVLPKKAALARETCHLAGVDHLVERVEGDACDHIAGFSGTAFCFLDAEKEVYAEVYELVVPHLLPGGILVANNAINHRETLQPMLDRALADTRVDALIMPIGKGELVCRRM